MKKFWVTITKTYDVVAPDAGDAVRQVQGGFVPFMFDSVEFEEIHDDPEDYPTPQAKQAS